MQQHDIPFSHAASSVTVMMEQTFCSAHILLVQIHSVCSQTAHAGDGSGTHSTCLTVFPTCLGTLLLGGHFWNMETVTCSVVFLSCDVLQAVLPCWHAMLVFVSHHAYFLPLPLLYSVMSE